MLREFTKVATLEILYTASFREILSGSFFLESSVSTFCLETKDTIFKSFGNGIWFMCQLFLSLNPIVIPPKIAGPTLSGCPSICEAIRYI